MFGKALAVPLKLVLPSVQQDMYIKHSSRRVETVPNYTLIFKMLNHTMLIIMRKASAIKLNVFKKVSTHFHFS